MIATEDLLASNILIVDDNPTNIALLEGILEEEGYENFTSTTDPRMVPDLIAGESFDLLLLDIRMPHLNGMELMKILKGQHKNDYLPIIVLTAQTDEDTRRQALAVGAKDFLTKPFRHWEVLLRIKNMLETRHYYKRQVVRADILEEEVRARTQALRDAQLEIVRRLGRAGEFRDNETGAHVVRVSKIAEILAKGLCLDPVKCELILHASPMHDVGKIAIPDAILLKNGPLSAGEREIMQRHAAVGGDIMGDHPSELIWVASQVALYHHERWDGGGYPTGIKGEAIPIEARIVAVSDVFDALTSVRPYKKAWPMDEAIEFIRTESGKHFDPRIVEVFLENLEAIKQIKQEFPDDEEPKESCRV